MAGVPFTKLPISVPAPFTRLILYNWIAPPTVNKASPEPDDTALFVTDVSTPGGMSKPLAFEKSNPTEPTGFWVPPFGPPDPFAIFNWSLDESKVYSVLATLPVSSLV